MGVATRETGFAFGPFTLVPAARTLTCAGAPVVLPPKAFDTLLTLLERRDRVVSKEELLRRLWPDISVEDASLTQQIFLVRRALGEQEGQQYIATIARRGYRFVADVREIGEEPVRPQRDSSDNAPLRLRTPGGSRVYSAVGVAAVVVAAVLAGIAIAAVIWPFRPSVASAARDLTFTQLTSDEGVESFPSLTPDGRWLIYAAGPLDFPGESDIYLRAAAPGLNSATNLTPDSPGADTQPAFSPDGEYVAFRSSRSGGGIFVMRRTGESVRRLTGDGFNPSWSPDGKEIVYASQMAGASPYARGAGPSPLWAVDVRTGGRRLVTGGDAMQPSWSPSGERIVYWGNPGSLYTISSQGGEPLLLLGGASAKEGEFHWNPVWAPGGRSVYFSSNRGGSVNLWRIAVDERTGAARGEPEPVTVPSTFAAHVTFSTGGARFAFASIPVTAPIIRLNFDAAAEKVIGDAVAITKGPRGTVYPEPSPDGRLVAFHSGPAPEDIYVSKADGSDARQITDDPVADRVARWSPDGGRLAFYSPKAGGIWQIWIANADGSGLHAASGPNMYFPVWSPDGRRIAATQRSERSVVFPADGPWNEKSVTVLPRPARDAHFVPWSWSPDGRRLAGHLGGNAREILVLSLEQQTYTRLPAARGKQPVWLSDGRRLVFASFDKLMIVDTVSQRVRELAAFSGSRIELAAGGGFGVSRDDRFIYVSPLRRHGDIWLAESRSSGR